jgi:hypothetical protein
VKVGDYGLVARLDPDGPAGNHGLTPKYVAPEALRGTPSTRSDQYSLALVYQELLTGTFPYPGKTPQQIMMHHVASKPDLSALPRGDQPIVGQALAKNPDERFGSCLGFVQALMTVASAAALPAARMEVRKARVDRSMAEMNLPVGEPIDPIEPADSSSPTSGGGRPPADPTQNYTLPGEPGITTSSKPGPLPKLVSGNARPVPPGTPSPSINTPAPVGKPVLPGNADPASKPGRYAVTLRPIRSVVRVAKLLGRDTGEPVLRPDEFAKAVVEHAARGAYLPQMPGDLGRMPDGTCVCQFPSTVPPSVIAIKLAAVCETWGTTVEHPEPTRIVLRRAVAAGGGFWGFSKKKAGFEVTIKLPPPGKVVGEFVITGGLFGDPDRETTRQALDALPRLVMEVRNELKNVEDRRKHPRVAANLGVTVYPIHSEGGIDAAIKGRCKDVSVGGVCVSLDASVPTKYFYVTFDGVEDTDGQAILVRMLRSQAAGREIVCAGHFRTDLVSSRD